MILCTILLSNAAMAQYPMQNFNMDIGNPAESGYRGFQQGQAMVDQMSNGNSGIDMNAIEQQYQFEQQLRLQKQQLQIQQQLLQQYQINSQQLYRR